MFHEPGTWWNTGENDKVEPCPLALHTCMGICICTQTHVHSPHTHTYLPSTYIRHVHHAHNHTHIAHKYIYIQHTYSTLYSHVHKTHISHIYHIHNRICSTYRHIQHTYNTLYALICTHTQQSIKLAKSWLTFHCYISELTPEWTAIQTELNRQILPQEYTEIVCHHQLPFSLPSRCSTSSNTTCGTVD